MVSRLCVALFHTSGRVCRRSMRAGSLHNADFDDDDDYYHDDRDDLEDERDFRKNPRGTRRNTLSPKSMDEGMASLLRELAEEQKSSQNKDAKHNPTVHRPEKAAVNAPPVPPPSLAQFVGKARKFAKDEEVGDSLICCLTHFRMFPSSLNSGWTSSPTKEQEWTKKIRRESDNAEFRP